MSVTRSRVPLYEMHQTLWCDLCIVFWHSDTSLQISGLKVSHHNGWVWDYSKLGLAHRKNWKFHMRSKYDHTAQQFALKSELLNVSLTWVASCNHGILTSANCGSPVTVCDRAAQLCAVRHSATVAIANVHVGAALHRPMKSVEIGYHTMEHWRVLCSSGISV